MHHLADKNTCSKRSQSRFQLQPEKQYKTGRQGWLNEVEIGGVKDLARYKTCILSTCKAKILVADDLVTCEKCNTSRVAQLAKTKLMAKLILIDVDLKPHTFVAHKEMLRNILSVCGQADTDITLEALLKIKRPSNITYDKFHVIQSVSR